MVEEAKLRMKTVRALAAVAVAAPTGSSRKPEAPILAARSDLANASKETAHDELPVLSVPGSPAVPLVAEEPAPSAHGAKEEIVTAQILNGALIAERWCRPALARTAADLQVEAAGDGPARKAPMPIEPSYAMTDHRGFGQEITAIRREQTPADGRQGS